MNSITNLKIKKLQLSILLLTAFAVNSIFSQPLFEGKLTYLLKSNTGIASESLTYEYYKGNSYVQDTPNLKTNLIYMDDSHQLVSVQSMMGTPIVAK